MRVMASVDADLCIGSTECNRIAPQAFRLDEAHGVSLPLPGAAETEESQLLLAAQACPTQAIRLVREDGSVLHEGAG